MASSTTFKVIFLACLLVGVFSQDVRKPKKSATSTKLVTAEATPAPAAATPAPAEATPSPSKSTPLVLRASTPSKNKDRLEDALALDAAAILALKEAERRLLEDQATHAVYNFATSIVDGIMDNMQARTESRNGLNVTGSYAYSDGYYRRSVHYIADENGFRIVSENVVPLGNGPHINPEGMAQIHTSIDGEDVQYNITKADIGLLNQPVKLPGRA